MNEAKAKRQAADDYIIQYADEHRSEAGIDFEAGWQAALEWQRSQCEPIGWRVAFTKAPRGNFQEGRPDYRTIEYWRHQGVDFEYCYASPPTAQINEQMREALQAIIQVNEDTSVKTYQEMERIAKQTLAAATPK